MSATLPNLNKVASWIFAKPFVRNFRPVRLVEYYKVGSKIHDKEGKKLAFIDPQFIFLINYHVFLII